MNNKSNIETGVVLYQKNKQQSKEGANRNEALNAYREKAFAECKAERLQAENNYLSNLVEYLSNYVMRAQTIEQLEDAKAGYREFQSKQSQEYQKQMQEQRIIWITELNMHKQ